MSFGTRMKALRRAVSPKMTQQTLADKSGVSRIYIQALEGDRRTPSMKLLGIIAECLGVQPSDLVSSTAVQGGRFQLDEFLKGNSGAEIWHRKRKLSPDELGFICKVVDAAVEQWEGDGIQQAAPKPAKKAAKEVKKNVRGKRGRPPKTRTAT